MYPDNYSYRAITRNPFTGEHGVATYPATHWNLPSTRPIELPKPDLAIAFQDRTRADDMPGLMPLILC